MLAIVLGRCFQCLGWCGASLALLLAVGSLAEFGRWRFPWVIAAVVTPFLVMLGIAFFGHALVAVGRRVERAGRSFALAGAGCVGWPIVAGFAAIVLGPREPELGESFAAASARLGRYLAPVDPSLEAMYRKDGYDFVRQYLGPHASDYRLVLVRNGEIVSVGMSSR